MSWVSSRKKGLLFSLNFSLKIMAKMFHMLLIHNYQELSNIMGPVPQFSQWNLKWRPSSWIITDSYSESVCAQLWPWFQGDKLRPKRKTSITENFPWSPCCHCPLSFSVIVIFHWWKTNMNLVQADPYKMLHMYPSLWSTPKWEVKLRDLYIYIFNDHIARTTSVSLFSKDSF